MLAVFLYFDDPVVITKYCLCITKMTALVMKKPRKCAETVIVISYNTTPYGCKGLTLKNSIHISKQT